MMDYDSSSKTSILKFAKGFIDRSLNDILTKEEKAIIMSDIEEYRSGRKGYFGDLVEKYIFGIQNNSDKAPDFSEAGIELKTTPLEKHSTRRYRAKERLVFSLINYMDIIDEDWMNSSFLAKNQLLLVMFYLYESDITLLDYKFKLVHLIDLLKNIPDDDMVQIKQDWQRIVDKVKAGEAHLLSEGDTSYLGAATKARSSRDRRRQPNSDILAKPRAFCFKKTYLNSLIDRYLQIEDDSDSLFSNNDLPKTIEENIEKRFEPFIGKTNEEIEEMIDLHYEQRPKNYRRLLVHRMLGTKSQKIKELEKADITLRVIALERSGKLKESISFPKFDYISIVDEVWEESKFYEQLTSKRFLFVVFRKTKDKQEIFEKVMFWNFPMKNIEQAQWVWEETVERIKNEKADALPGMTENPVAHVRPHARNKDDVLPTPYGTYEVKKSFWLNAKYIEQQIK